ncbi:BRO family protein [Pseudomonas sp. HS6-2]|uniref:BRO family protein n=1 Tax=Pseudomonas sp. HS6-2 TaxID=3410986 RepID=UPI003BCBED7B
MGIELDVLVGHPEHKLLFVATQVARAAGLTAPSSSVSEYRKTESGKKGALTLADPLIKESLISVPKDQLGRAFRSTTALGTESWVYQMLLRGHSPQSEPFRRWVTEEVLPTIRKGSREFH